MCLWIRLEKVAGICSREARLLSLPPFKIARPKIEACLAPQHVCGAFHPAPADTSAAKQIRGVDKGAFKRTDRHQLLKQQRNSKLSSGQRANVLHAVSCSPDKCFILLFIFLHFSPSSVSGQPPTWLLSSSSSSAFLFSATLPRAFCLTVIPHGFHVPADELFHVCGSHH